MTLAKVPITAPETLAEGEFNRFYARGLCLRAMAQGIESLVVYRAKDVVNPRPESVALIGKSLPAKQLLDDLRAGFCVDLEPYRKAWVRSALGPWAARN
jgi:hypothetical protein